MDKLKIIVVCHKAADIFENDIYTPIQVGKALSSVDLGYIGDNTGDNISERNKQYCELTALYWAWKNLNCDYLGLCHYRRYFSKEYTSDNIETDMKDCDVILVNRYHIQNSLLNWWRQALAEEDVYIFYHLLLERNKEYAKIIDQVLFGNSFYPCNMFVCKKQLFDDFAKWQFGFFDEFYKIAKLSGYSRMQRVIAYFGEVMWTIYVSLKHLIVKEVPCVKMIGEKVELLHQSIWRKTEMDLKFRLINKQNLNWDYAAIIGLKMDGIIDDNGELIRKMV